VDDVRVRAIGKTSRAKRTPPLTQAARVKKVKPGRPDELVKVYFEETGRVDTPVYTLEKLAIGTQIKGPALIIDRHHTVVVEPGCSALVLAEYVLLHIDSVQRVKVTVERDPVMLAIFGHRFMGIAEQMGEALRKTAVSTNVKERLDFSCAIFGPDGGLVANGKYGGWCQ
jgi:5-oxoprolinase (ATP-hydrolysing)